MSIEAWLARALGDGAAYPFDAVRLGVVQSMTQRLQYGLCGRESGKPAPIIVDPNVAYTSLFGSVASAAGRRAFDERTDLLSFAEADVRRVVGAFSGSSAERQKLDVYLESLETLQRRQTRLLDAQARLQQVRTSDPTEDGRFTSVHPLERLEVQFELATAALLGNLTPVVLLTSGAKDFDLTYSSLEPIFREDPDFQAVKGRHFVCHNSDGNAAYLKVLNRVTERHVEMMANMARALSRVPEGDGTMLDHTAILYISDNGDQHHSPGTEWPALLLGGSALGLRTDGRTVVYPKLGEGNHRQISNLFNTLGWASGRPLNDFGGEGATRIALGPLPELFA
jgi:hypothetical protein